MAPTILDQSELVPEYSPICALCRHLTGKRACAAFGGAPIPLVIWLGQNDHRAPVDGDRGMQFEAAPVEEEMSA